jgi:hypothetical protein
VESEIGQVGRAEQQVGTKRHLDPAQLELNLDDKRAAAAEAAAKAAAKKKKK